MIINDFHLEGIYNDKVYVIDATALYPGINIHSDYDMRYAAKDVLRYGEVPDGSDFRHYFERVRVVDDVGAVWAEAGPGGLYRWL